MISALNHPDSSSCQIEVTPQTSGVTVIFWGIIHLIASIPQSGAHPHQTSSSARLLRETHATFSAPLFPRQATGQSKVHQVIMALSLSLLQARWLFECFPRYLHIHPEMH